MKKKRKRKKPEPIYRTNNLLLIESKLALCGKHCSIDQQINITKQFT